MGYVRSGTSIDKNYVMAGTYELEVAAVRVPAAVTLAPLFDPKMEKVKA